MFSYSISLLFYVSYGARHVGKDYSVRADLIAASVSELFAAPAGHVTLYLVPLVGGFSY